MNDASEMRRVAMYRQPREHDPRSARDLGLGAAIALAVLASGCGLKGPLTLPEKPRNVVIRPGPGGEAAPVPAPAPETEPLPPPELPPDTRGNTRG
jgi:hypothetical protein